MMELLTVAETAVLLKTTKQQVRKMIAQRLIPALKVGVNGASIEIIWKASCEVKWNRIVPTSSAHRSPKAVAFVPSWCYNL